MKIKPARQQLLVTQFGTISKHKPSDAMGAERIVRVKIGDVDGVPIVANVNQQRSQIQRQHVWRNPRSKSDRIGFTLRATVDDGIYPVAEVEHIDVVACPTRQGVTACASGETFHPVSPDQRICVCASTDVNTARQHLCRGHLRAIGKLVVLDADAAFCQCIRVVARRQHHAHAAGAAATTAATPTDINGLKRQRLRHAIAGRAVISSGLHHAAPERQVVRRNPRPELDRIDAVGIPSLVVAEPLRQAGDVPGRLIDEGNAALARQHVIAVMALLAEQAVVAIPDDDGVIAPTPHHGVVPGAAVNEQAGAVVAKLRAGLGVVVIEAGEAIVIDGVVAATAKHRAATPEVHDVVAAAGVDGFDLGAVDGRDDIAPVKRVA